MVAVLFKPRGGETYTVNLKLFIEVVAVAIDKETCIHQLQHMSTRPLMDCNHHYQEEPETHKYYWNCEYCLLTLQSCKITFWLDIFHPPFDSVKLSPRFQHIKPGL